MKKSVDVHKTFASYFNGIEFWAYAVSQALEKGHLCLNIAGYQEQLKSSELENPFYELFPEQTTLEYLMQHSMVSTGGDELKPFVIDENRFYLQRFYTYETAILNNLKRLTEANHFNIITGGPGTGKTYSVSIKLVELFNQNPSLKVALAAPTGKAAARMNESIRKFAANSPAGITLHDATREQLINLKASTLHRLLGLRKNSAHTTYNEANLLPFDVVIVDESSMIDGALLAKLLIATATNTQLFLLGDKDQLASVDAGSVFGDICRAGKESVLLKGVIEYKTQSRRFNAGGGIGRFSREVIESTFTTAETYANDPQLTIDERYRQDLFKEAALSFRTFIEESDPGKALNCINDVRFLCVTLDYQTGVHETNRRIEKILKTEIGDTEKFNPRAGYYHNQPIIIQKNNPELDLYNGDVGLIRLENNSLMAYFETIEGDIRKIPAGYLTNFSTVFAMTIHKSQGSEFKEVVVLLPEKSTGELLTRELLYTGVTRAINRAIVQSGHDTLHACIQREVARVSGLAQRLNQTEL